MQTIYAEGLPPFREIETLWDVILDTTQGARFLMTIESVLRDPAVKHGFKLELTEGLFDRLSGGDHYLITFAGKLYPATLRVRGLESVRNRLYLLTGVIDDPAFWA